GPPPSYKSRARRHRSDRPAGGATTSMPITSRAVVEFVLLGPTHDRRQLQDSPILGDVWAEFASNPTAAVDLLISPTRTESAGPVATTLARRLRTMDVKPHPPGQEAHV